MAQPLLIRLVKLGNLDDLITELGGKVGKTYACALKKAAGIKTRKFEIDRAVRWLRENPDFQISDAYPRKKKR